MKEIKMDFKNLVHKINRDPCTKQEELNIVHRENRPEGDRTSQDTISTGQGQWSPERHATIHMSDTSTRGELLNLARNAWPPREEQVTRSSDQLALTNDSAPATEKRLELSQSTSHTYENEHGFEVPSSPLQLSNKGKSRATEAEQAQWQIESDGQLALQTQQEVSTTGECLELPRRIPYTKPKLESHITTLLDEMKVNQVTKIAGTSIGKLWRAKEKELTKEEIDDIKQIIVDLRENNKLDDIISGKNGNDICGIIRRYAVASSSEGRETLRKHNEEWYAVPENKARHNAYYAVRYSNSRQAEKPK